jgi:hypothetical protein
MGFVCNMYKNMHLNSQKRSRSYYTQTTWLLVLSDHYILRSSSWSDKPLRNIQFSNDIGNLPFYVDVFVLLSPTRFLPDVTICGTQRVSYKKHALLTLRAHVGLQPIFGGVCDAHLFSFLCCVIPFVLLIFILCNVWPMLSVYLDFGCI